MNKVSVVIPAYNSAKTISRTIDSVINQSYEALEIIIINDGSTDKTLDIVRELSIKDSRIRIIDKKNEGVSVARNVGIQTAGGEYITFIDSDDWVEKTYIEELLSAIQINNAEVSKCAFKYITENSQRVRIRHIPEVICTGLQGYSQFLCGKGWASSACATLYSLSFLRNNNIFFPNGIPVGEDGIFTITVLRKASNIVTTNVPLLNVSVRESSASRSGVVYDVSHQYVDKIDRSNEFSELRDVYKLRVITSNLMRTAYRASYEDFRKIYRIAISENYKKLNTAKNRTKLNSIMCITSLVSKNPIVLFYTIKTAKRMGIKLLF